MKANSVCIESDGHSEQDSLPDTVELSGKVMVRSNEKQFTPCFGKQHSC